MSFEQEIYESVDDMEDEKVFSRCIAREIDIEDLMEKMREKLVEDILEHGTYGV